MLKSGHQLPCTLRDRRSAIEGVCVSRVHVAHKRTKSENASSAYHPRIKNPVASNVSTAVVAPEWRTTVSTKLLASFIAVSIKIESA